MTNDKTVTMSRELAELSAESYSVVIGMVEHCLNVRACMGMDEGFKDFDTEEEHDFVKEIRAFVAKANDAAPVVERQEPVALPNRKTTNHTFPTTYNIGAVDGWNACLDKVRELNQ
jgi:hypothetical protein